MYATVAAAAALHHVLLRSLGDDKVVVQNVASGLFCVLPHVRLGLYALLGLQYYWGFCILKKVARSIDRCPSSSKLIR